ncbi:MAG: pitrilysin family protein [Minicystis sp.]
MILRPLGGTLAAALLFQAVPASAAPAPSLPVERFTLDNGLRVVLHVDRTLPTVAFTVSYDVGSRDEARGRTGFAHLFEHMMFQGSENVPKGEHARLIQGRGGTLNGGTGTDLTHYFNTLPAGELALGLWLEADRMRALDITQASFENQREVVKEEEHGGLAGLFGRAGRRMDELVFRDYWPYAHPTGGVMADLDAADFAWVRDFHAHHYGPNNAVLSLAGSFDPAEAKALIQRYFGPVPRITVTPFQDVPMPEQTAPRDEAMTTETARTPGLGYAFAIPSTRDPDHYALELSAMLLAGGESSRLHRLLVKDRGLAQSVEFDRPLLRRGPDAFAIWIKLAEGAQLAAVETLVEAEIQRLATTAPPAAELQRVQRVRRSEAIFRLQGYLERSIWIGAFELLYGDARLLDQEIPRFEAVTPDDVRRVAARWLSPSRRCRVEVRPAGGKP